MRWSKSAPSGSTARWSMTTSSAALQVCISIPVSACARRRSATSSMMSSRSASFVGVPVLADGWRRVDRHVRAPPSRLRLRCRVDRSRWAPSSGRSPFSGTARSLSEALSLSGRVSLCPEEVFEVLGKTVAIGMHLFGGRHVREGAAFEFQ